MKKVKISRQQADAIESIRNGEGIIKEVVRKQLNKEWWAKHDRDVWELREDDILHDDEGNIFTVHRVIGLIEGEENVLFKWTERDFLENVKELYSVVCFSENRADI